MIQKAIERIKELVEGGLAFETLLGPNGERYWLRRKDGELLATVNPPCARFTALRPKHVAQLYNEATNMDAMNEAGRNDALPLVLVGLNTILVMSRDYEVRVKCRLQNSAALTTLSDWAYGKPGMAHAEFIDFVRRQVDILDPAIPAAFRNLRFSKASEGQSTIEHFASTLGNKVEKAVMAGMALPEILKVVFSPWENSEVAVEIECFVDINIEKALLALRPQAAKLQIAVQKALDFLARSTGEELGVFSAFGEWTGETDVCIGDE